MRKKFFTKGYIAPLAGLLMAMGGVTAANAGPVTVKASLDSVQILMGRMATMRLQVVQDENVRGTFPLLQPNERGYAAVCGDSVELRTSIKRDTTPLGSGRIQVDWQVPVQAFDSGVYRLPEMVYVAGRDSVRSNPLTFKVTPFPGVTAEDKIADFAGTVDPAGKSFWDFLPDWLVEWGWLILFIMMLALIAFEETLSRRPRGGLIPAPQVPKEAPDAEALRRLGELKERKLWEQGQEKEYFTILTDILRNYLDRRFGINAMEMTSRQIMQTLAADSTLKEKRGLVRQILDMADFVKFAKVRPLPDDSVAAWNNAVAFVNETKSISATAEEKGGES
ncbi:MAG: cell wall anchor protein [Muribaculaceae bacterium]|nr:cell wall anchor protein [Muribaculaceae bacterium]